MRSFEITGRPLTLLSLQISDQWSSVFRQILHQLLRGRDIQRDDFLSGSPYVLLFVNRHFRILGRINPDHHNIADVTQKAVKLRRFGICHPHGRFVLRQSRNGSRQLAIQQSSGFSLPCIFVHYDQDFISKPGCPLHKDGLFRLWRPVTRCPAYQGKQDHD